ncbi:MAG: DUF4340 domain-containing protein [Acidobacteria bacterium]|nr:DUF4340 domain-containing protein [Acidobacteriota bacterium]
MKIWHTVVASIILLALGGTLFYLRQQPETPSSDGFPKRDLFVFQPEQVEEFTMDIANSPSATFRRGQPSSGTNGQPQWEIVSPPGIAASRPAIQSFLEELPKVKAVTLDLQAPSSLAEYGLDQPQRTYTFKLKDGRDTALLIGKENPNGFGRYGKLSNSTEVFMLDSLNASPLLDKTLFDLRDRRLLPVDMDQAQEFELHYYLRGGAPDGVEMEEARRRQVLLNPPKVALTRLLSGEWQLTNPAVRTDHGNTAEFARIVGSAQVQSFEEENPTALGRYGLAPAEMRLQVKTPSGSYSLLVGNRKSGEQGSYYAKNSVWPHVFTIDQGVYFQLTDGYERYRSRYLFDYSAAPSTRRVEIQAADRTIRFDKKGDSWVNPQKPQSQMDGSKVDGFLSYVYALRIQHFTSDQPGRLADYGLDKPWMTVTVITGEDNRAETILFGRNKDRFYAARQGEPSVYEMSPDEPATMESRLRELSS